MFGDSGLHPGQKSLTLGDLRQFPRRRSGASSSLSVLNDALKRRSISFQPGVRMVLPLAVNSFPGTGECGGDSLVHRAGHLAHSLQHTRGQQFLFATLGQPSKPFCTNSIVGMMAWWSLTFCCSAPGQTAGAQVKPAAKGKAAAQAGPRLFPPLARISSVKYWLSVRGDRSAAFFIELLGIVKGLLCGIAIDTVCLPLQGGEVV